MDSTKLLFSSLVCLAPFACKAGQRGDTRKNQRNIVVFIADDLARNELGCYGGQNVKTPNIDRFAGEGVRFNRMFSSTTMCSPTRASIYTGLYPVKNGVYKNHAATKPEIKSAVHYFTEIGYRVGLTGKTHFRPESVYPFEKVEGFEPDCVSKTADYTTSGIVEFMKRDREQPFCLFICSTNPHAPWTVGDPSKFDPAKLKLPPHFVDNEETRAAFAKYLAEIAELDRQFGDVLKAIELAGKKNETLVMFCGEQGPQFPGGKWTNWDYGQKSGFIIRTPEKYLKGKTSEATLQYEDVLPTLLEYTGNKTPENFDGKSFLPVLLGQKATHREWAYGVHNNVPEGTPYPIRSIRNDRYKLIVNLSPEATYYEKHLMNTNPAGNYWSAWLRDAKNSEPAKYWVDRYLSRPEFELYDTTNDPWELKNLASDKKMQPVIDRMKEELFRWMQEQGDPGKLLDVETENVYNNLQGLVPDCADPYILNHDGKYYLYGTGGGKGIRVYQSDNLANWSDAVGVNDGFALDSADVWGHHSFWAPEVYFLNQKFYMFFSVMEHLAIAESESPLGPFIQKKKQPLHPDIKEIDSHLFVDTDGKMYLYFVRFTGGNEIWMAEMKDDLSGIKEESLTRCFGASEPWERTAKEPVARVAEGPFVLKHNNLYYLSYSANHFRSQDYAVGYAVSESPFGPFRKYENNPVLNGDGKTIFGTGHHSFFTANSGQMYIVYHSHKSGKSVQPRTTCLDRCGFEKDGENKPDKLVVYGPTTTPQPVR